jgi:hypothetical protein
MSRQMIVKNGWTLVIDKCGPEVWLSNGPKFEFVARFKHGSPMASANHFARFLVANFSPAEYFALLNEKLPTLRGSRTPAEILEAKGYVPYNVLKIIKAHGRAAVAGTRWA